MESTRCSGFIRRWSAERRFGFISSGGRDYFAHVSDFAAEIQPRVGLVVTFSKSEDARGRTRAVLILEADATDVPICPSCGRPTIH